MMALDQLRSFYWLFAFLLAIPASILAFVASGSGDDADLVPALNSFLRHGSKLLFVLTAVWLVARLFHFDFHFYDATGFATGSILRNLPVMLLVAVLYAAMAASLKGRRA